MPDAAPTAVAVAPAQQVDQSHPLLPQQPAMDDVDMPDYLTNPTAFVSPPFSPDAELPPSRPAPPTEQPDLAAMVEQAKQEPRPAGTDEPLTLSNRQREGEQPRAAAIYNTQGLNLGMTGEDDLVWKVACKTGTLKLSPGPGQTDLETPLVLTADMFDDMVLSAKEQAFPYITVPETHGNGALENTGYVRAYEVLGRDELLMDARLPEKHRPIIAADPEDTKYLLAGIEFTEPDIKQKALNGSIPDTSIGVKFGYRNKRTGKQYRVAWEHLALTPMPWVDGLVPFGLSQQAGVFDQEQHDYEIEGVYLPLELGVKARVTPGDAEWEYDYDQAPDPKQLRLDIVRAINVIGDNGTVDLPYSGKISRHDGFWVVYEDYEKIAGIRDNPDEAVALAMVSMKVRYEKMRKNRANDMPALAVPTPMPPWPDEDGYVPGIPDVAKQGAPGNVGLSQEPAEGDTLHMAIDFDPKKHPRDLKGQFRKTVDGLKPGETAKLPDGTSVTRNTNKKAGEFDLRTGDGEQRFHKDADGVVDDALKSSTSTGPKGKIESGESDEIDDEPKGSEAGPDDDIPSPDDEPDEDGEPLTGEGDEPEIPTEPANETATETVNNLAGLLSADGEAYSVESYGDNSFVLQDDNESGEYWYEISNDEGEWQIGAWEAFDPNDPEATGYGDYEPSDAAQYFTGSSLEDVIDQAFGIKTAELKTKTERGLSKTKDRLKGATEARVSDDEFRELNEWLGSDALPPTIFTALAGSNGDLSKLRDQDRLTLEQALEFDPQVSRTGAAKSLLAKLMKMRHGGELSQGPRSRRGHPLSRSGRTGTITSMPTVEELLAERQAESEAQAARIQQLEADLASRDQTNLSLSQQVHTDAVNRRVAKLQATGVSPAVCAIAKQVYLKDNPHAVDAAADLNLSVQVADKDGDREVTIQRPSEIVDLMLSAMPRGEVDAAQMAAITSGLGEMSLSQPNATNAKSEADKQADVEAWERESHPERFAENGKGARL